MNSIKKQLMVIVSLVVLVAVGTVGLINLYYLNDIKDMTTESTEKELFLNYDSKIKELVETAEGILERNNKLYEAGELTLEEAQEKAKETIRGIRYGKDDVGYFWIDNEKYINILLPPAPDAEGSSRENLKDDKGTYLVKELVDGATSEEDGTFVNYYFPKPGQKEASLKRGYAVNFKDWGWIIGTGNYVDDIEAVVAEFNGDIKSEINKVKIISISTIIILISLALAIIFIYTTKLSNSIKEVRDSIDKIANNDLTGEDLEIKEKHEIGDLKNYYNKMKNNLKNMVSEINGEAMNVAASAEELTATSEQVSLASDEVARTIEDIANGATDQADETTSGAMETGELGEIINSEIQLVEVLNKSAENVIKLKEEGLMALEILEEKTDISNDSVKEVQSIIIETNKNADKIESASVMIRGIAEQTNLLALNASIEAARAGEAGKGFAVVADEIRKLAEETNQFAGEISNTILELSEMTQHGVKTMDKVKEITEEQTDSVNNTNNKFEGIASSIEDVKNVVGELNDFTETLMNKKEKIINIMENLSAISEENAAGTQEASASVEEQTASMAQIAKASDELAELAENLQSSMSKFRL